MRRLAAGLLAGALAGAGLWSPPPARAAPAPAAIVEVTAAGMTALTDQALSAAGFPADGDPALVHLTRAGSEIALERDAAGARFLFYAAPRANRYTAADAYYLSYGSPPGRRMAARAADPAGLPAGRLWTDQVFEQNRLYTAECYCGPVAAGRDGDHWTWDSLRRLDRPTAAYSLTFASLAPAQPAALTVWLIGATDSLGAAPNHRVDAALNGVPLGTAEWTGRAAVTATVPISAGVLAVGVNTLTLSLPGLAGVFVEEAWLDAFALRSVRGSSSVDPALTFTGEVTASAYTLTSADPAGLRVYDITDPDAPESVTGLTSGGARIIGDPATNWPRRYAAVAPAGILTPARVRAVQPLPAVSGADEVMLAPAAFLPALAPLIALRQSQGLSVAAVDVQAVYDAYDGRPLPEALRAYLADALAHWSPRPAYVLLVGDGTANPRRYNGGQNENWIPAYLGDFDQTGGETAADNRYVTGAAAAPEAALGRLPVNTVTETQVVVDKIVQYETAPAPGAWAGRALFVADAPDPQAGDFPAQLQALSSAYWSPAAMLTVTQPVTTTHQALLDRWRAGAGLVAYNGHASLHQWSVARAFHLDDVPALTNGGRLPVVLELTCFTGAFHTPGQSLDENLLRLPGGGAVAVWGDTSLGDSGGHTALAAGFLARWRAAGGPRLGAAVLAGAQALAGYPQWQYLWDTFTLLGDPALRLNTAPGADIFLPLVRR